MATPTATAPVHPHAEQFATESFGMTEGWSPVAAFPETTGQGVGAGLEPKELLIRFLGSDETLLDFVAQRFSVFFGPLVLAGLLESVFNRRFLKSQNRGYPAQKRCGSRCRHWCGCGRLFATGFLSHNGAAGDGRHQKPGNCQYGYPTSPQIGPSFQVCGNSVAYYSHR